MEAPTVGLDADGRRHDPPPIDATVLAVVWDMGGIFYEYFTEPMVALGRRRDWPLHRVPMGPTGAVPDEDYVEMCRGDIDEPTYLQRVIDRLGAEGIDYHPRHDPEWKPRPRSATWSLIRDVHAAGRTQAILTNDGSKWRGEGWWERWTDAYLFAAVVDVATLDVRKPHPDAYRAACDAIERPPDTCVFIDDMPVNCAAAEAVGMQSVWFDVTNPESSIDRLRERIALP